MIHVEQFYVSPIVKRIQQRLNCTDNGIKFKDSIKLAIGTGVDQFIQHLHTGRAQVNTVSDFEKIVKLGLLVYGEPTERTEVATITDETHLKAIVSMPEFETLKNRLAEQMNRNNEAD